MTDQPTALERVGASAPTAEALIRTHIGDLDTEANVTTAMEFYLKMDEFAKVWRGIHAEVKQGLIDWMTENDRGFTIGDHRIFVADKKSPAKCNDTTKALNEVALAILEGNETALDEISPFLDAIFEYLSSSAVLPGKLKKTLGKEAFGRHFTIKKYQTVGKEAIPELVDVNTRFTK